MQNYTPINIKLQVDSQKVRASVILFLIIFFTSITFVTLMFAFIKNNANAQILKQRIYPTGTEKVYK